MRGFPALTRVLVQKWTREFDWSSNTLTIQHFCILAYNPAIQNFSYKAQVTSSQMALNVINEKFLRIRDQMLNVAFMILL